MMKNLLILFFLFFSVNLFAQEKYTLDQILDSLIQNHPLKGDHDRLNSISEKTLSNLRVNYFPQLDLNAQATYQSDVVNLDINVPGIDISAPSKDQYKVSLDVSQTIYDAGITRKSLEVESEKIKYSLSELDARINNDKQEVLDLFYSFLLLQENQKILQVTLNYLMNNRKIVEAAFQNGMVLHSDLDLMDVEILKLKQNMSELNIKMISLLSILSEKTGLSLEFGFCQFQKTGFIEPEDILIKRIEIDMFEQNKVLLDKYAGLQDSKRLPKVFLFGQLGYGKPGLNMLANNFDTYYFAGAGVKWNIWDWNKTNREKEILQIKSQMIDSQKEIFENTIENALITQNADIAIHKSNMENYQRILGLRKKISSTYASQLEKGTIRTIDYLNVLDEEKKASISLANEEVLYQKSIAMYRFYQGKL
jgi:outer membrane protein TolC